MRYKNNLANLPTVMANKESEKTQPTVNKIQRKTSITWLENSDAKKDFSIVSAVAKESQDNNQSQPNAKHTRTNSLPHIASNTSTHLKELALTPQNAEQLIHDSTILLSSISRASTLAITPSWHSPVYTHMHTIVSTLITDCTLSIRSNRPVYLFPSMHAMIIELNRWVNRCDGIIGYIKNIGKRIDNMIRPFGEIIVSAGDIEGKMNQLSALIINETNRILVGGEENIEKIKRETREETKKEYTDKITSLEQAITQRDQLIQSLRSDLDKSSPLSSPSTLQSHDKGR